MIYRIEFSKEADKTLKKWKKSNPRLFKKATALLLDIMQHPRTGIGHPEALIGGKDITEVYVKYLCFLGSWLDF